MESIEGTMSIRSEYIVCFVFGAISIIFALSVPQLIWIKLREFQPIIPDPWFVRYSPLGMFFEWIINNLTTPS